MLSKRLLFYSRWINIEYRRELNAGRFAHYSTLLNSIFSHAISESFWGIFTILLPPAYNMIKEQGEFVINLTNQKLARATDWCGVKTGAKVDKFKEMKLTKEKCNFVNCPSIKESPVSIECKVDKIVEMGSHHMFVADVLSINANEKYIDEKGAFDISKCNLIAYANGGYYELGNKIGKFGYAVAKKQKKK